jgi:hypothetical protein
LAIQVISSFAFNIQIADRNYKVLIFRFFKVHMFMETNKGDTMKLVTSLLAASVLMLCASTVFAGPTCTKEPKEKWRTEEEFKKVQIDEGYKIKVFKVTKGNCYEIYGTNKEGKKIEIYFNPVDFSKVKEKIK